jgi:transposase-like protein
MPGHRRRFSPQLKAEAVQMVIETGKPIAELARDLGMPRAPTNGRGKKFVSEEGELGRGGLNEI